MAFINKIVLIVLGMIMGGGAITFPYLKNLDDIERKAQIKINDQFIVAEVVKSPEAREQGLAGRESIGVNEGMLFIFDNQERHGFWMKGMKIPIDIIWTQDNEIVGLEESVPPPEDPLSPDKELTIYYPPEPVDQVLELRSGRIRLLQARIGDATRLRPIAPSLIPR
jgi:hypothetical protein